MINSYNNDEIKESPLITVFHSNNGDEIEAKKPESSRKVIKATITIPMPKVDMTVIRFRNNNHGKVVEGTYNKERDESSSSESLIFDDESLSDEETELINSPKCTPNQQKISPVHLHLQVKP